MPARTNPHAELTSRWRLFSAVVLALAVPAAIAQPRPHPQLAPGGAFAEVGEILPVRPIGTTEQLAGLEDTIATAELEAAHPFDADAEFEFTITSLPAAGELRQADGTPISSAPTAVTDPAGYISYFGAPDACSFGGVPVSSFTYTATHAQTQIASVPKSVSIVLNPVYDPVPHVADQVTNEDSTLYIQLPPSVEGCYYITEAFDDFCLFHQVQADNLTPGAIIEPAIHPVLVTNADRWIALVPQPNICGNTSAYFSYSDTIDNWPSLNPYEHDWRVNIDVACVNDAPMAFGQAVPCYNDQLETQLDLSFSDPDGTQVLLAGSFTQAPQQGRLYRGTVAPENEVTLESNNTFDSYDRHFIYVRNADLLWQWGYTDQLAFRVTDGELLSNAATITFNVVYRNLPPTIEPDTTLSINLDEDGEGWAEIAADDEQGWVNVSIVPSALPQNGQMFCAAPQFGGGYQLQPITVGEPLPLPLGDPFTTWELVYIPDPDFNTSGGPPDAFRFIAYDSFGQRALDPAYPEWQNVPGEWTISLHVAAINDRPVINGPATIPADWRNPALVTSISIADDADSDAILRINVSSTDSTLSFVDLSGVNVTMQTPNAATFEGTSGQINAALLAGINVPTPGVPGVSRHLIVTANDLGNSGGGGPLSALRVFEVGFE